MAKATGADHRSRRAVLLLAVLLVVGLVMAGAIRWRGEPTAGSPKVAVGGTIAFVLRCSGPGTFCQGGATDDDGAEWIWMTSSGQAIPPEWWSTDVRGELTIADDWGDSTFATDDGHIVTLSGGRITATHHFTDQG